MAHTPGPWAAREPDPIERAEDVADGRPPEEQELTEVYSEDDGEQVCYVMNTTPAESANARLIAAAPEMLDLLRSVRVIVEAAGHMDLSVRIWNLIAKAEGRV